MPRLGVSSKPSGNGVIAATPLPSKQSAVALSLAQLRAMGNLSSGARTTGDLGPAAGACGGLLAMGLVGRTVVDLDGRKESLWVLTAAGKAALARSPDVKEERRIPPADLRVGALVPWFGAARRTADAFAEPLRGCNWVGVPFAGSLAEVPAIFAAGVRDVALNDKHRHLINLARTAACPVLGPELWRRLRRQPFAPEVLADAQRHSLAYSRTGASPDLDAAFWYFISAWAGRSGKAGTDGELKGGIAARWDAGGGNSALRFSGAAWSLRAWRTILARCSFSSVCALDFLKKVKDAKGIGVYADPPWPDEGGGYLHKFSVDQHRLLAARLAEFRLARAVVRSGGDTLTRSLYPESLWTWKSVLGRNQGNTFEGEWVIVNKGAK